MQATGVVRLCAAACLCFAALISRPVDAGNFSPAIGNYLHPPSVGWGLDLQRIGNIIFVLWFTYREDGTPIWYLAVGELTGMTWTGNIDQFHWDGDSAKATSVGTMTLVWSDAEHATMTWVLDTVPGEIPVEFLHFGEGLTDVDWTGHYFPPDESGWGASVLTQGAVSAKFLYFYDAAGDPVWLLGISAIAGFTQVFDMQLFNGPGLCPSCLLSRSDHWEGPTTEHVADIGDHYVFWAVPEDVDADSTTMERLVAVYYSTDTVNGDTALGTQPFSAITLPAGSGNAGPFQTLVPLTPAPHAFTNAQQDYLRQALTLDYDPASFLVPATCIGSLTVHVEIPAAPQTGYPQPTFQGEPFSFFYAPLGDTDISSIAFARAGDTTVVTGFVGHWPEEGVSQGLLLISRSTTFVIDELLGLESKQVMSVRTVPGLNQLPFLGQVYRNRVDFAGDSGILSSVCARIVESE